MFQLFRFVVGFQFYTKKKTTYDCFQNIIKNGGKPNVEEIKVTENAEELMAKNYATALERMQNALKRETQIKIVKQMNERNKANNVSVRIFTLICSQNQVN